MLLLGDYSFYCSWMNKEVGWIKRCGEAIIYKKNSAMLKVVSNAILAGGHS